MPEPCRRPPRAPAARREAQRLQGEAEKALAEAEALKLQARLEDLTVWEMEKVKQSRKGSKIYTYWMASWREGGKTRNVHLGSARKMDGEAARRKARERKAEALGVKKILTENEYSLNRAVTEMFRLRGISAGFGPG